MPAPSASATSSSRFQAFRPRTTLSSLLLRPFVVPFVLLSVVGISVIAGVERNAQAARQVTESQGRLLLINSLLRDISELETGQRGYVITGQADFLKPYLDGLIAFDEHAHQLRRRSVTPAQISSLNQAADQLARWRLTAGDPQIRARRTSLEQAVRLISTGRRQLDNVRATLTIMREREDARLTAAVQSSAQTLRTVRQITVAGLLLTLLLLLLTALRMARTVARHLSQLTAGAQEISAGQYDRHLPRSGVQEIDELGHQFQEMARAVREREQALAHSAQALKASNEQLAHSNRELEQFAYVASHDLQEPLRTIGSYTELLARRYQGQLDARADQYITFTIDATSRMKTLIQDLLAFSRVRQGQRTFTSVDTHLLVREVLTSLDEEVQRSAAQVHVAPGFPQVHGNADLLRHVFHNLIGNALKFRSPERPLQIAVSATREEDRRRWVFHIQDNGIGIEEQYFDRIFGVFQRLHGLGEYSGSGIGLAVTRSAVEQHGGELWLGSRPGQGSTFHFSIPDHGTVPGPNPLQETTDS
ncbi:ATP-binding protein [Deinococcus deserti]|uniref:histidine kinase n=1 Tax=Deinococcus deserti (strain DSM 17065 / CIP 109153 / LMG 22923 / VCD115) TaxID=546414 RepID=C1CYH5_DEIDV|nr:ATP-binding protein [Deinococcus deserti]ACO44996.1 putative histidine kinase, classic; putative membrane protein [Deinococcus deserti VCD115]